LRCSPFFSSSSGEGPFAGVQRQQSDLNTGEAVLIGERMESDGPNFGEAFVHRSTELKMEVLDFNISRDGPLG